MSRILGSILILIGASATAMASQLVPEIDSRSGLTAVALLSGGLLILRARRKR